MQSSDLLQEVQEDQVIGLLHYLLNFCDNYLLYVLGNDTRC